MFAYLPANCINLLHVPNQCFVFRLLSLSKQTLNLFPRCFQSSAENRPITIQENNSMNELIATKVAYLENACELRQHYSDWMSIAIENSAITFETRLKSSLSPWQQPEFYSQVLSTICQKFAATAKSLLVLCIVKELGDKAKLRQCESGHCRVSFTAFWSKLR